MKAKRIVVVLVVAVVAVLALGALGSQLLAAEDRPFALFQDDEEDEAEGPNVPITGDALDRASEAALEYVGEGRVTDTEVGDEEGYYEVEVTLDDGRQVDVHLDEDFNVLGQVDDEE